MPSKPLDNAGEQENNERRLVMLACALVALDIDRLAW
jgi:hypothetical protein